MHIGLVTPSWPGDNVANGITTAVAHLAAGLKARGHEITVFPLNVSPGAAPDDAVRNLVPEPPLGLMGRFRRWRDEDEAAHDVYARRLSATIRAAIAERGVEIVIVEETQGWFARLAQDLPVPVVVTLHGPAFLILPHELQTYDHGDRGRLRRESQAFRHAAGLTAPTPSVLRAARGEFDLENIPSVVIPNAMPQRSPLDYAGMPEAQRGKILFVGRFDRLKGVDTVLQAFTGLVQEGLECSLTIVGPDKGIPRADGSRQHAAEALAELPDAVRARIDFRGMCNRDEVDDMRRAHGLSVIASRFETSGYNLVESMATGLGIVCTRTGGLADIARHEETALMVPHGEAGALGAAIRRMIEEPGLAARLGQAAHAEIGAHYLPEIVADQTVEFLKDILARR